MPSSSGSAPLSSEERDALEPPAGDPQAAVAGDDGSGAGVRELLGEPFVVAPPRIPGAIERGSRERVLHPLDVRPTGHEARIGRARSAPSAFLIHCTAFWSTTIVEVLGDVGPALVLEQHVGRAAEERRLYGVTTSS